VVPSFDRLFADLYRDFATPTSTLARPAPVSRRPVSFTPRVSVEELEDAFRVVAEVPGVEAKDLDVNVEDGVLTIQGVRHYGDVPAAEAEKVDAEKVGADHEESVAAPEGAKFERRIAFRSEIVEVGVTAGLKNGLLTVTVPKPAEVKPEVRSIPVETA
jgi:HSP20 family protein